MPHNSASTCDITAPMLTLHLVRLLQKSEGRYFREVKGEYFAELWSISYASLSADDR